MGKMFKHMMAYDGLCEKLWTNFTQLFLSFHWIH